jgi:OOP family OmpA-OmpF porin
MLDVAPASEGITAPRFSVEMLRNDDGIQLIGLMPETPAEGGLTEAGLVRGGRRADPRGSTRPTCWNRRLSRAPTWEPALPSG